VVGPVHLRKDPLMRWLLWLAVIVLAPPAALLLAGGLAMLGMLIYTFIKPIYEQIRGRDKV